MGYLSSAAETLKKSEISVWMNPKLIKKENDLSYSNSEQTKDTGKHGLQIDHSLEKTVQSYKFFYSYAN